MLCVTATFVPAHILSRAHQMFNGANIFETKVVMKNLTQFIPNILFSSLIIVGIMKYKKFL